jgi:hypothetical protein
MLISIKFLLCIFTKFTIENEDAVKYIFRQMFNSH